MPYPNASHCLSIIIDGVFPVSASEWMTEIAGYVKLTTKAEVFNSENKDDSDEKFKLFCIRNHQYYEDLIDDSLELGPIISSLNKNFYEGNILFPWVYGPRLFERAKRMFNNEPDNLTPTQTARLLSEKPSGVFQVGPFLCGPLGLLEIEQIRDNFPLKAALLHICGDPSCEAVHPVKLTEREVNTTRYAKLKGFRESFKEKKTYREFNSYLGHYNDHLIQNIDFFLGNCFSEKERKKICHSLLQSYGKEIRALLAQSPAPQKKWSQSSESIIKELSESEIFQIILIMDDCIILKTIDSLVSNKEIVVPATEIRSAKYQRSPRGAFDTNCQLSSHGVRINSKTDNLGVARLRYFIEKNYSTKERREQIDWRLNTCVGNNLSERLEYALYSFEPAEMVRDFIVRDKTAFNNVKETFPYSVIELKGEHGAEDQLVQKLLWLFGFNVTKNLGPIYLLDPI